MLQAFINVYFTTGSLSSVIKTIHPLRAVHKAICATSSAAVQTLQTLRRASAKADAFIMCFMQCKSINTKSKELEHKLIILAITTCFYLAARQHK